MGSGIILPELCQKPEPEDIHKLARIHSAAIDNLLSTLMMITVAAKYRQNLWGDIYGSSLEYIGRMELQFWFTSVQLLVETLVATRTLQNYGRILFCQK